MSVSIVEMFLLMLIMIKHNRIISTFQTFLQHFYSVASQHRSVEFRETSTLLCLFQTLDTRSVMNLSEEDEVSNGARVLSDCINHVSLTYSDTCSCSYLEQHREQYCRLLLANLITMYCVS